MRLPRIPQAHRLPGRKPPPETQWTIVLQHPPNLDVAMILYWEQILLPLGGPGQAPIEQTGQSAAPALGVCGEEDGNPSPADVATIAAACKSPSLSREVGRTLFHEGARRFLVILHRHAQRFHRQRGVQHQIDLVFEPLVGRELGPADGPRRPRRKSLRQGQCLIVGFPRRHDPIDHADALRLAGLDVLSQVFFGTSLAYDLPLR
jgi:hypothetical protein